MAEVFVLYRGPSIQGFRRAITAQLPQSLQHFLVAAWKVQILQWVEPQLLLTGGRPVRSLARDRSVYTFLSLLLLLRGFTHVVRLDRSTAGQI